MKNNYIYKISYILICISFLVILLFVGAFILQFNTHPISNNLEHWGQLGDYIGGVLNPLLSLINICIFVILTLTIQKITNKNNQVALDTQKQVAMMSMKHEELKNLLVKTTK